MLIRTLLLAIFLISAALSVCAAEPVRSSDVTESGTTPTSSSDVAESATLPADSSKLASARAMTMDEALKCVTVSAEDCTDGNTYYICYTFTNPTSVAIDKKVDLTTVAYKRRSLKDPFEYVYQCSTELTDLMIPPYGKYKSTISFPQKDSFFFNQHMYSKFCFDDGAFLKFDEEFYRNPSSLVRLATVISPENELFLSIQNRSWFNTITDLSTLAIQLDNRCGYKFKFASEKPLALNIPPRGTYLLYIDSLVPQFFDIPDSLRKLPRLPKHLRKYTKKHNPYFILMNAELTLNHIRYHYNGMLSMTQPCAILEESTLTPLPQISYDYGSGVARSWDNTNNIYYLDDSYLYIYFELTNTSNNMILPSPKQDGYSYMINAAYFDQDMYRHNNFVEISLPTDFTLAPNETRYFTFKIPLPDDFYTLDPSQDRYLIPQEPNLHYIELFPKENFSLPVPQDTYQFLDIIP